MNQANPIGKIVFKIHPQQKKAHIKLIKVDSKFRSHKTGSALFKQCYNYLKKSGYNLINWTAYSIDSVDLETLQIIYLKMVQKLRTTEGLEFTMHPVEEQDNNRINMQLKIRKA